MSERVNIQDFVKREGDEDLAVWSQRLMDAGHKHGVYRQCSLGWHGECSQRSDHGPDCPCNCKCHVEPRTFDMDFFNETDSLASGVDRVKDYDGNLWTLAEYNSWRRAENVRYCDTEELLRRFGPVTEVVANG